MNHKIMDYSLLLGIYYSAVSQYQMYQNMRKPSKTQKKKLERVLDENGDSKNPVNDEEEENLKVKEPVVMGGDESHSGEAKANLNETAQDQTGYSMSSNYEELDSMDSYKSEPYCYPEPPTPDSTSFSILSYFFFNSCFVPFQKKKKKANGRYDNKRQKFGQSEKKAANLRGAANAKLALPADVIEGPGVYYMGIIDTLQKWNWKKRIERFFKVRVWCNDAKGISCAEPEYYRERFLNKMGDIGIKIV
ncbi:phosphatidylinositol-4-phosphate 5-Kinase [Reticulomyxa filosa]|uniref:Phosphatidylinositol-4-phosphate 5-Kinase n=1 Tax=Reticulomyxa filosa TaxID=46433 RepID=X6NE04_RETFI|nr:phosphatidylinositol-4-phosphate 5-Kinase [Reticulomyxa filosa]|eukprot:ETO23577.1 phosphatidylinositol-4-phosphate 5-Kinase [Reticulomyxa filosa]